MSERGEEREDSQAVEERAATTRTQPMARIEPREQREEFQGGETDSQRRADSREKSDPAGSSGLMHDKRWQEFAGRWDSIQSGFVDDPRRTVEQADRLVAEVIDHLSRIFTQERAKLEAQWSKSGEADTEDLRLAMRRYRDFFRTLVGGDASP